MSFKQTDYTNFCDQVLRIRCDFGQELFNEFSMNKSLMEVCLFTEDQVWQFISELEYYYKKKIDLFVDENLTADNIWNYLKG